MISIYSLIWTFINCGVMTLLIKFLRRKKNFLARYGTFTLLVLSICSVIRLLVPVEFPKHQFLLDDLSVFSILMKPFFFIVKTDGFRDIVVGIWIIGSISFILKIVTNFIISHQALISHEREADAFVLEVMKEVAPSSDIPIRISSGISVPFVNGYLHRTIYLPDKTYTRDELYFILTHEYTHCRRKDNWKKLFLNILHIIFWWNPFIYVLKQEADYLIEFNCDKQLTDHRSEREVLNYLQTLWDNLDKNDNNNGLLSPSAVRLSGNAKNPSIVQRFNLLLNRNLKSRTSIVPKIVVLLLMALWMWASYYFILQTNYDIPKDDVWGTHTVLMSNEDNAYLEEQADGSYLFYYEGIDHPLLIPKSDVEAGYYNLYPIIEYEQDTNIFSKIISWFTNNFK